MMVNFVLLIDLWIFIVTGRPLNNREIKKYLSVVVIFGFNMCSFVYIHLLCNRRYYDKKEGISETVHVCIYL